MAALGRAADLTGTRELSKEELDRAWTRPGTSWSAFAGKDLLQRAVRGANAARLPRGLKYRLDRDVSDYLTEEPAYTQLAPRREKFLKPFYSITKMYHLIEADLIETGRVAHLNDGVRYLLFAIEGASRLCAVYPLLNKEGASVAAGFKHLLDNEFGENPDTVRTDRSVIALCSLTLA